MPTYIDLPDEQKGLIRAALADALPQDVHADFEEDGTMERNGEILLMIQPREYPEAMYDFIGALAKAEIALRDQGLKVRLHPDVRQRMLVVATLESGGEVAYLSTDGSELEDLQRALGVRVKELAGAEYATYPYDSEDDLVYALDEARAEHPDADYGRAEIEWAAP